MADRQQHRKLRSLADPAFHMNVAAMTLDDIVRKGQAETDSLTGLLGGKEWVPDPVDRFLGYTAAGIPDTDCDHFIIRVVRRHLNQTAPGDCLVGVDQQV